LLITTTPIYGEPFVVDQNFSIEKYVSDLTLPTAFSFIEDDILVLELKGNVRLIRDGILQTEPILQLPVGDKGTRGLLGMTTNDSSVYLYLTEKNPDINQILGNRIYKYTWNGNELVDPVLVKDLPINVEGFRHNGGTMTTGLDGTIFAVIGDLDNEGLLQNFGTGNFDDSGVILVVNFDETVLKPSQSNNPQEHYFAMGIRNSFGLAIDPVTGYLWDTENGNNDFDEINLVLPGFNSGWEKIMGPSTEDQQKNLPHLDNFEYSDPEFSWESPVAPTGLSFVNSSLFDFYTDSLFVGDFNTGTLYRFTLNSERTGFVFDDKGLQDKVLNLDDSRIEITFGGGFLGITDIDFGPDGLLYVLNIGDGSIYRIMPSKALEDIPVWIKDDISDWSNNLVEDSRFIETIEYLIENNIIVPTKLPEEIKPLEDFIPSWFKKNAQWWVDDLISDSDYLSSIKFLVNEQTIQVKKYGTKCSIPLGTGVDLSGCDLSSRNFSGKNISDSKMNNAILTGVNFKGAKMNNVDFSRSDLSNANLKGIISIGANFDSANLTGANLKRSDLSGSTLRYATLINANLSSSELFNVDLRNANLNQVNLTKANLHRSILDDADLSNSILVNAHLKRAEMNNVILIDAQMRGANLQGADLDDSNLQRADLTDAHLKNAKLHSASLKNAILVNGHLEGIYFHSADLSGANFTDANLTNANFRMANLFSADLTGADLKGADLFLANLLNSKIQDTNFKLANTFGCIGCPFFP